MYPLHRDLFSCNCAYALSYGLLLLRGILYEAKKVEQLRLKKLNKRLTEKKARCLNEEDLVLYPVKHIGV